MEIELYFLFKKTPSLWEGWDGILNIQHRLKNTEYGNRTLFFVLRKLLP
jgi:hypothetical protein